MPLMVQKTDGGFGYGTTDIAALRQRVQAERGEWLIYVVDEGQSGHFKRALSSSVAHTPVRTEAGCCVVVSSCGPALVRGAVNTGAGRRYRCIST